MCAVRAARSLSQSRITYALCRPPGHHASDLRYGGYCYFNNAAVAVRALQSKCDVKRVAVVDVDYHHGNGTQDIFYEDPDVLYCSIHADPDHGGEPYFSGYSDETGVGEGEGTTFNVPIKPKITDEAFLEGLKQITTRVKTFAPEVLVVSLGVDIFCEDPLALLGGITLEAFSKMGAALGDLRLPTLVIQEGGYHPTLTGDVRL